MKTLIMTAIVMILASSVNNEIYGSTVSLGNGPKAKVLKRNKNHKRSSKFKVKNINKCSKMGKKERGGVSFL